MPQVERQTPVSPGEPAPDFTLLAADGSGPISLADFKEKSPLFLALFAGLWCPFCRRAIAQTAAAEPSLKALGVETLAVVATPLENAQLYFKFRAPSLRIAVDPELSTHRAYGVPKPEATPELVEAFSTTKINPDGDFPEPLPIPEAAAFLTRMDGYSGNETDRADAQRQWPQLKGQFLIDREGFVRWANIECAKEGLSGVGKFPSPEEIAAAARATGALQ